jgi:hypothetical protein
MLGERALVSAVDTNVGQTVGPVSHDKGAGQRTDPEPIPKFVGRVDLSNPNVVKVPLTSDTMNGRAERSEKLPQELAYLIDSSGAPTVDREETAVRRQQRHGRVQIEAVDDPEQLVGR